MIKEKLHQAKNALPDHVPMPHMSGPAVVVTTLLTAAFVSAAAAAYVAKRYGLLGRSSTRPKWISKSKHPQLARFVSEGGDVPEVSSLRPGSR